MAKRSHRVLSTLLAGGLLLAGIPAAAQQGGGRGPGRAAAAPVPYDDYTGFSKLWDGATFTNWNGETDVWSIEDGAIHADTTKTPGQHHIHYTGPRAIMRDFDLKVEVKLSAAGANGGIQYRSRLLHASHGGSIQDPFGRACHQASPFAQAVAGLATAPRPRRRRGQSRRRRQRRGSESSRRSAAPARDAADPLGRTVPRPSPIRGR
jgi:hypothetical protein